MQAVILAAGKGTRMGDKTVDFPKALLKYKDKTLIEWKIDAFSENIEETIIVIGHSGEKIKEFLKDKYSNIKITFVEENEMRGTGYALWKAREILGEHFLVLMGDDIYSSESILLASKESWSITVKKVERIDTSSRVLINAEKKFEEFVTAKKYKELRNDGGFAFTGLYSLKKDIFNFPLVKMQTKDEWGLPQTLASIKDQINIKILQTDFWIPVSTPEDLFHPIN